LLGVSSSFQRYLARLNRYNIDEVIVKKLMYHLWYIRGVNLNYLLYIYNIWSRYSYKAVLHRAKFSVMSFELRNRVATKMSFVLGDVESTCIFQVSLTMHIHKSITKIHYKHQIYSKYILSPNKLNISIIQSFKKIKLKQKFDLLLSNISLIQFYNILHQKINSYFEYMIMSFLKIYDKYFRLLSRKYYFIEDNSYLKKEK